MQSFTLFPDSDSSLKEKRKGSIVSWLKYSCRTRRRSFPSRLLAWVPRFKKFLMTSASILLSFAFASLYPLHSIPKIRYFDLIIPLFPFAACFFNISVYSSRMSSKSSPCRGMSNWSISVCSLTCLLNKNSSNRMDGSK